MEQRNRIAFVNGTVFTADKNNPSATGVYVEDNIIRMVGDAETITQSIPEGTQVVDLNGKTLLPGFIDAHNHITLEGAAQGAVKFDFPEVASIDDMIAAVKKAAEQTPEGRWIRGWGLNHAKFPEKRYPTRWDIDEVSPDHPVCIVHYTGHYVLVNSVALAMAGITDDVEDPEGGQFIRDEEGRVTGFVLDSAQQFVVPTSVEMGHHGPDIGYDTPLDELVEDIERACKSFIAEGVTTVCDPQVTTREMPGFFETRRQGKLGVRCVAMYMSNHLDAVHELGITGAIGDDWLEIGPIKYYCDGSIVGGTAAFYAPLDHSPDTYGSTYWGRDELIESLTDTHKRGLQFGIHGQGDLAIDMILNAVENAQVRYPREDPRHRIEHCHGVSKEQIERIARLGVYPVSQPGQVNEAGDVLVYNYGRERAERMLPLRDMFDAGVCVVLSTDAFVQSYRPLDAIAAAVTRKVWNDDYLGKNQAITIEEALTGYTINAARSLFREDRYGSIEVGKVADLTVIDGEILEVPSEEIVNLSVDMTVVDGKIVFSKDN